MVMVMAMVMAMAMEMATMNNIETYHWERQSIYRDIGADDMMIIGDD